jgi:hypothetical protein
MDWSLDDFKSKSAALDILRTSEGLIQLIANSKVPLDYVCRKLTTTELLTQGVSYRQNPDEILELLRMLIGKLERESIGPGFHFFILRPLHIYTASFPIMEFIENNSSLLRKHYSRIEIRNISVDMFRRIRRRPFPRYIAFTMGPLVYRIKDLIQGYFGRSNKDLTYLVAGFIEKKWRLSHHNVSSAGVDAWNHSLAIETMLSQVAEWADFCYDGNLDRVPITDMVPIVVNSAFARLRLNITSVASFLASFGVKKERIITEIAANVDETRDLLYSLARTTDEELSEIREIARLRQRSASVTVLHNLITELVKINLKELLQHGLRPRNNGMLSVFWENRDLFYAGIEFMVEDECIVLRSTEDAQLAIEYGCYLHHCYRNSHAKLYLGGMQEGRRFLMWLFKKGVDVPFEVSRVKWSHLVRWYHDHREVLSEARIVKQICT